MLATNNEQPLANATMFFEVGFEVDPLRMHFNPLHNFFLQLERKCNISLLNLLFPVLFQYSECNCCNISSFWKISITYFFKNKKKGKKLKLKTNLLIFYMLLACSERIWKVARIFIKIGFRTLIQILIFVSPQVLFVGSL